MAQLDNSGFADPIDAPAGGEGDAQEATPGYARSPIKVLQALSERPLQQAIKAIEYIDNVRDRERKLLKVCSPQALSLIASNGPEYLTAVKAVSN